MATVQEKSLPLAIGLNFVLPGAGYIYMGRVVLGIGAMLLLSAIVLSAGLLLLVPTWVGINVIMAIDMVILFNKNKVAVEAETMRKCPFCAESIRAEATLCKHCHKDVIPQAGGMGVPVGASRKSSKLVLMAGGFVVLLIVVAVLMNGGSSSSPSSTSASSFLKTFEPTVTMAEFGRLQTGMTYQQAVEVIGAPGEEMSRSELAGYTTVMYVWKNTDASNMNAMFQNGALMNKAQFGLK